VLKRGNGQRGQALVESALFLPLMLLATFSIIFFSRLGVLSERGESAVRYANFVTFRQGDAYTVATVYDLLNELLNPQSNELGPLCLTPNSQTANPDNAPAEAALSALEQQQPAVSATPVPATKNFWKPDSTPLAPACNPLSVNLTSGTYGIGSLPLSVTSFSVTAAVNEPQILRAAIGSNQTTSSMAFLNVATPNLLVACVPGVSVALYVLSDLTYGGTPNCNATQNPVSF
jgi:hypothetical protein